MTWLACARNFPPLGTEETLTELQMQPTSTDITRRLSFCFARSNRLIIRRILLFGLTTCFLFAQQARAADELVPPFGFRWNDSMARVEAVLHGAKAKIVSREKKENRELWTVEGLIHPGLKRTVFTFKERALVAVTSGAQATNGSTSMFMSFAVSGATTQAATDARSLILLGNALQQSTASFVLSGLNPGSTTFTAQYKVSGSGTATFSNRSLFVIPLS